MSDMNSRRRMSALRRGPQSSTSLGDEGRVRCGKMLLLMSVQGQPRKSPSGLLCRLRPPADIGRIGLGPGGANAQQPTLARSFDYLVSDGKNSGRYVEVERFRGLQVDD